VAGQEPKYVNSPESPLFQKKRTLYGLAQARDAIRKRERAVLVEGYFDHLALLRRGSRRPSPRWAPR
jgi:DNA primase